MDAYERIQLIKQARKERDLAYGKEVNLYTQHRKGFASQEDLEKVRGELRDKEDTLNKLTGISFLD